MTGTALLASGAVLALAALVRLGDGRRRRLRAARRLVPVADPAGVAAPGRSGGRPSVAPPAFVVHRLRAADVRTDPGRVWTVWLATVAGSVGAAVAGGGAGLGVVAVLVGVGGPVLAGWALGDRADRRVEAALPEVLESVAASLRSGASLRQAVGEAAGRAPDAVAPDLRAVGADLAGGRTLVEALDAWVGRRPLPGIRLTVAALALGAETGGAHARAVDGVAATIRSRLAVTAEVRALSSQARFSGLVIALAPIAFGAVAALTDGRTATFLFRTPVGVACLTTGLALDALAAVWMHRLAEVER